MTITTYRLTYIGPEPYDVIVRALTLGEAKRKGRIKAGKGQLVAYEIIATELIPNYPE